MPNQKYAIRTSVCVSHGNPPFERREMHAHAVKLLAHLPSSRILPYYLIALVVLARKTFRLAFTNNLLAEPLSRKAALEHAEISYDIATALDDRVLGCDGAVGRDAQLEGCEERVRYFVGGEDDVIVLEEALREKVAERVVLFVEGKDSGVGNAWNLSLVGDVVG